MPLNPHKHGVYECVCMYVHTNSCVCACTFMYYGWTFTCICICIYMIVYGCMYLYACMCMCEFEDSYVLAHEYAHQSINTSKHSQTHPAGCIYTYSVLMHLCAPNLLPMVRVMMHYAQPLHYPHSVCAPEQHSSHNALRARGRQQLHQAHLVCAWAGICTKTRSRRCLRACSRALRHFNGCE